jgi:hypothetical protein
VELGSKQKEFERALDYIKGQYEEQLTLTR